MRDKKEKDDGIQGLSYGQLCQTHPDYDAEYWDRCQRLFAGGKELLENDDIMSRVFPRHREEHNKIYAERKKCANYIPYAAGIIANTVLGVFSDPPVISFCKPSPFHDEFQKDVTHPDKRERKSFLTLCAESLLTTLIKGTCWTQLDVKEAIGEYDNRKEEEEAGASRPYAILVQPETVIDWCEDEDGDLEWCILRKLDNRRLSIQGGRESMIETFYVYTKTEFQKYEIVYNKDEPPDEDDIVRLVKEGFHSFGVVPLVRMSAPGSLWSMGKMEPACRALLRDLSSLQWSVRQSLHKELYEFLGGDGTVLRPVGEIQEDRKRAVNQRRGQGYTQVRGADDRAEFIGPGVEGFQFALDLIKMHREELHRINNQMGINADMSAGAMRRSAESKNADIVASENLYREIGSTLVKRYIEDIFLFVSKIVKCDHEAIVTGMEKFSDAATHGHIEDAILVQGMAIESRTFQIEMKMDAVMSHLGRTLDKETADKIREELEESIRVEQVETGMMTQEEAEAIIAASQQSDKDPDDDEEIKDIESEIHL